MRAIGITDLIVAPGLLAARPRWPWLIARAALNVGLVATMPGHRRKVTTWTSWVTFSDVRKAASYKLAMSADLRRAASPPPGMVSVIFTEEPTTKRIEPPE